MNKEIKSEYEVDVIIYDIVEDFIWITKEEFASLYISLLTLQSMLHNLNYNPRYEICRNLVQVKWYNISDNIIEVMVFYRNRRLFSSKLTTGDIKKEPDVD